jgi:hypothetical protein
MRTLIVDDSKTDRSALRGMLERVSAVTGINEAECLDRARGVLSEIGRAHV